MTNEYKKRIGMKGILLVILFAKLAVIAQINGTKSKWDEALLSIEFRDVSIRTSGISAAWKEIGTKYLLRANFYKDAGADSDLTIFGFKKEAASGKEILDAFLATYPAYTYTQDKESGVIWIHPKRINYEDILNQKIKIDHPNYQIPMFTSVYKPLCSLLSPGVIAAPLGRSGLLDPSGQPYPPTSYCYFIDLHSGGGAAIDILNLCCVANPTKAFMIVPESSGSKDSLSISILDLSYLNPMAPPRVAALKFWEIEIDKPTNGIPSIDEVNAAFCDIDPAKRLAAVVYLEAAQANYSPVRLIEKTDDPEKAVWVALGVEQTLYRGVGDLKFFKNVAIHIPRIMNDLMQIKDPRLALIASLELTREQQDTSYLDAVVSKHTFSEAEIASIKSDIYRLAHESNLVLDKLKAIKLNEPEFSPEALRKLESTNLFTLVPVATK
jgi:hypothetical protein